MFHRPQPLPRPIDCMSRGLPFPSFALRHGHICVALRAPRERRSFSLGYQAAGRRLLHEVGKVAGEARRMGCGKQEWVAEGSLLRSCKPAGLEAAGHTPSGPSGHLPRFAEKGVRGDCLSARRHPLVTPAFHLTSREHTSESVAARQILRVAAPPAHPHPTSAPSSTPRSPAGSQRPSAPRPPPRPARGPRSRPAAAP